jgi:hypothetical protein
MLFPAAQLNGLPPILPGAREAIDPSRQMGGEFAITLPSGSLRLDQGAYAFIGQDFQQ